MATKSILKNVYINDNKRGRSLVVALENASGKKAKDVKLCRTYNDIRGEKLKEILGKDL